MTTATDNITLGSWLEFAEVAGFGHNLVEDRSCLPPLTPPSGFARNVVLIGHDINVDLAALALDSEINLPLLRNRHAYNITTVIDTKQIARYHWGDKRASYELQRLAIDLPLHIQQLGSGKIFLTAAVSIVPAFCVLGRDDAPILWRSPVTPGYGDPILLFLDCTIKELVVGILDTRVFHTKVPGDNGKNWLNEVRYIHWKSADVNAQLDSLLRGLAKEGMDLDWTQFKTQPQLLPASPVSSRMPAPRSPIPAPVNIDRLPVPDRRLSTLSPSSPGPPVHSGCNHHARWKRLGAGACRAELHVGCRGGSATMLLECGKCKKVVCNKCQRLLTDHSGSKSHGKRVGDEGYMGKWKR